MDIASVRRKRLRHLIDTDYGGSQAAFVEKTGINQGELSGLLRKKSFGEKRARSLEVAAGLPEMYFDNLGLGADGKSGASTIGVLPDLQVSAKTLPATRLTKEQKQLLSLMERMSKDELETLLKVGASLAGPDKSPAPKRFGDERRQRERAVTHERRETPFNYNKRMK